MSRSPKVCRPEDGHPFSLVGDLYRMLVTGEETGGRYAMFEATVFPGGGPPLHTHSREEESFYILEGEIRFTVGETEFDAGPGTFANMPVGSLHTFRNASDRPARMIISVAPAGFEKMVQEVATPATPGEAPPRPTNAEIEELLATAPRYGLTIFPPGA